MRLDREDIKDIKEALICDKDRRPLSYTCCIELFETIEGLYGDVDSLMEQLNRNIFAMDDAEAKIEALQQENEQLKADCDRMLGEVQELTMEYNHFKERLQISPYGDDKIDELDEALENCKFQYEQLKQENEQLQAQAARMREAIQEFVDTANILTGSNESIIAEGSTYWKFKQVLSDTPAEYHNPADLEALRKAKEAIKAAWSDGSVNVAMNKASEALTAIDKIIGGKEDGK